MPLRSFSFGSGAHDALAAVIKKPRIEMVGNRRLSALRILLRPAN
jgi:hypothetical protein